jgi:hypothetical protein
VVLLSLVLTLAVSSWWLLLTALVRLNLLQASFTGFWPAAVHLGRFGVPSGCVLTAPCRSAQRRVPSAHH